MKTIYSSLLILLLFGCNPDKKEADSTAFYQEGKVSDSSRPLKPKAEFPEPVKLESCAFDSLSFKKIMGKGLVELTLSPYNYERKDSIIIADVSSEYVMRLIDEHGWRLEIDHEKYEYFIKAFQRPTFGQHYQFIWKAGQKGNVEIQSFYGDQVYTIKSQLNFDTIAWSQYLKGHSISILSACKFYKEANSESKLITNPPQGYFTVSDVSNEWIQLSYIDRSDPEGKKTSAPSGWVRWFCDDSVRIKFLTDIDMESYFEQ